MQNKNQITIKDLAKQLNISASTVSRALRDHIDVSTKTKLKVHELSKQLDYQPNRIAQSLQKNQSNTIGVIVPEIKHDFFSAALDGIEDMAFDAGYTIIVSKSNESYRREVANLRALVSHRVAGLIISLSQTTQIYEHFKILQRQKIPFVYFDRICAEMNESQVIVDDHDGAFSAVEHLINQGYRKIAHLAGPQQLVMASERLRGYCSALKKHNISLNDEYVIYNGLHEEDGILGFDKLLLLEDKPDAIFAVNDPVAIGVFQKMKEKGMNIPGDYAIVGFSDNPLCALIDPPLTTVAQPAYDMGMIAAELLLERIHSQPEDWQSVKKVLKTNLVIREST